MRRYADALIFIYSPIFAICCRFFADVFHLRCRCRVLAVTMRHAAAPPPLRFCRFAAPCHYADTPYADAMLPLC